jgi:oligo-1,6-glucosidase
MHKSWWQEAVVYQVYPRSFQDSNNDGIGDLTGVVEHLDYIKQLGVDVIWLNPIYKSPNADNGYDIADYEKIMAEFGTMADFKHLLNEAHARGLKVMMDLVVNHTSDEHPWFQAAKQSRTDPHHDWYIWRDPVTVMNRPTGGLISVALRGPMCQKSVNTTCIFLRPSNQISIGRILQYGKPCST